MATIFQASTLQHDDAVELTDIDFRTNELTPATIDFKDSGTDHVSNTSQYAAQLKVVDQLFGPLEIGSFSITRSALDALGATIGGLPLEGSNTFFRVPKRSFINALQFSASAIETRMKATTAADDYNLPSLLFEIASRRPMTAPVLLRDETRTADKSGSYRLKLEKLLNAAQKLDVRRANMPKNTPSWVNRVKSSSMASTGVGLQAFGLYSGLRGLQDAIKNKNSYETLFNSASIAVELSSVAVEVAVAKKATQMIKAGQHAYKDFTKTMVGVRLGRAGGLIAGALTLPFDIIAAVNAFDAASKATGKEATAHYVSAGLSITSAAMTVILGIAALAGFSFAGPVGLVAGLLLVAGSQIWGAVGAVDEIDDYIELTTIERLRTGWFAFWGISPDKNVQDLYLIAKAASEHSRMLRAMSEKLLNGPLKDSTEVIVNGNFNVTIKQVPVRTTSWWTGKQTIELVDRPQINDGDDVIDARSGVSKDTPGAVFGSAGDHKSVLWLLGKGTDTILGVEKKPNIFQYATGIKDLTGGDKDDEFVFEDSALLLADGPNDAFISRLDGGPGSDTLVMTGRLDELPDTRLGYRIELDYGLMSIITLTPDRKDRWNYRHTRLASIENVETLAGARSEVKGTDGPNIITARGNDKIAAGAGDDQMYLLGGTTIADGGPGTDSYAITHQKGSIYITEDGVEDSIIALDWRMDLIESWKIEDLRLVITSRFDLDDTREKRVVIEGVYQNTDHQRTLRNRKLTFITKDHFHLAPELPDTLPAGALCDIEVVITQPGRVQRPIILYKPECKVAHDKNTHYYVSPSAERITFDVTRPSKSALTTIYLDVSSHELSRIETSYKADLRREVNINRIMYTECSMTLHFGAKQLAFKNLASSLSVGLQKINERLTAPSLWLNHHFILILNDNVSYRLVQPGLSVDVFANDRFEITGPLSFTCEVALPLTARNGKFAFVRPHDNEAHTLGTREKCVRLDAQPEQTAVEHLVGEGSKYLVHLSHDMTWRVSTPGALAGATPRLPYSSTWEFDATQLGSVDIKLVNNRLHVGSTVIYLPEYDSPQDLIDQVSVITANGIVHVVDLIFEAVYIGGIDARYFLPPSDSTKALPKELTDANSEGLTVTNIAMRDGTPGLLTYHPQERRWMLEDDKARSIQLADLRVVNHCLHHIPQFQYFVNVALKNNPALEAEALTRLRRHSLQLMEDRTLRE
ncbi:calcium-binding protein [Pseudomonas sp. LB3P14]